MRENLPVILPVFDTTFDQYLANINSRSELAKIAIRDAGNKVDAEKHLYAILSHIKFDEFIKTRVPGIVGLEHLSVLRSHADSFTSFASGEERVMFVNSTTNFSLPEDCVSISSHRIYGTPYPRIGVESGVITTIEQFLFVFYHDVRIVSCEKVLRGQV